MKHISIITTDNDARRKALFELIPDLFTENYKTVLYIGANGSRFDFSQSFFSANYKMTVVEICQDAVDNLKVNNKNIHNIICSDIKTYTTQEKFDIIFWWHGPEHIHEQYLAETLSKLESYCNKAVVLGCPWGNSYGDATHYSHYNYLTFENLGYNVICTGTKDQCGPVDQASGMVMVKYV